MRLPMRLKSWLESIQDGAASAAPRRITAPTASARHGANMSSKTNAESRCSRYGAELGRRPVDLAHEEAPPAAARSAPSGPQRPGIQWLELRRSRAATSGGSGAGTARCAAGRRAGRGASRSGRSRRRGSRPRPGRARIAQRPASPPRPPDGASRGRAARRRTSAGHRPVRPSRLHAGPPKAARQLLGGRSTQT